MKYIMIAIAAVVLSIGENSFAADATYAWKADEHPASILQGQVTFTYDGANKITAMNVAPVDGGTITFTGDKMEFASPSYWKNSAAGKVVFQNETSGGTFYVNNIMSSNKTRFTYRFESAAKFSGSPTAYNYIRLEFADVPNTIKTACYPIADGSGTGAGQIAYQDGSATFSGRSKSGVGTFIFENTELSTAAHEIGLDNDWTFRGNFIVRGTDDYPMTLEILSQMALPTNGTVTVENGGVLRLSVGSNNVNDGVKHGACAMVVKAGGVIQQSCSNCFATNQVLTIDGGTLALSIPGADGAEPAPYDVGSTLHTVTLRNGARIVNGSATATKPLRIGRSNQFGSIWTIDGTSPSTNTVVLQGMGSGVSTNIFDVAKTGDYDADFVQDAKYAQYSGSSSYLYETNFVRKLGAGTMRLNDIFNVPGGVFVEGGFLKLGANYVWGKDTYGSRTPITFAGGGLSAAAGTTNFFDKVTFQDETAIKVEKDAVVTFSTPSNVTFTPGKRVNITVPTDPTTKALLGGVRIGYNVYGKTEEQLADVRMNGRRVKLGSDGFLQYLNPGLAIIFR